jgi:hypothetical protein
MRTIQTAILKFEELSDEAKQKAKYDYAADCGYSWGDEAFESLKALAAHFDGKLKDWSIDYFGGPSHCSFDMPEMSPKDIRAKLKELGTYNKQTGRGNGDCKLTGVCFDEDCIDGFRLAFRAGERDLTELMDAAFDSWLKTVQADCEYQYSDEAFQEHCEANGYEFEEDGTFAR